MSFLRSARMPPGRKGRRCACTAHCIATPAAAAIGAFSNKARAIAGQRGARARGLPRRRK
ncbi:hypothetical protein A2G96_31195 [Cupriavidus nantongensis]|uniref:Uncharacterized protein n=1 Tax=Cupriavidus nantongensis TaxID=1796606 RepID=A0A142JVS7_9BURK|nr:hypothetical protein A2G96_31195 [Cupriavidus nantongensis]